MLVIGVSGHELTARERDWLQHEGCAGVILFLRNFASKAQVMELTQSIREAAPRRTIGCQATTVSTAGRHCMQTSALFARPRRRALYRTSLFHRPQPAAT